MRKRKRRTIETDIFGLDTEGFENINSKQKGNRNELVAAKWLTRWTGQPFARVPSSGGLRWANTVNACGDVICTNQDFDFPFSVETKHLKRLSLPLKLKSGSKVRSIWEQCSEDALRAKKRGMMMLRRDNMKSGAFIVYFDFAIPDLDSCSYGYGLYGYQTENLIEIEFLNIKNYM